MRQVSLFLLFAVCFSLQFCSILGRNSRFYFGDYYQPEPPTPPPRPYWIPVPQCPPEIYYTNRLACYNSGRYMDSPNNINQNVFLSGRKKQGRSLQANIELAKFRTHTRYQPGVTGNNVVLL